MRIALIFLLFSLSSCWMMRANKVRKLQLMDHEKLPSVPIAASDQPYLFYKVHDKSPYQQLETAVDSIIGNTQTAAFLVIRNDSLIYEKYFMGFDEHTILPSNSMAKSFTGTLVGIALDEGKIKSDLEPITNYLPKLGKTDPGFHNITIRHLLDMRSGLDFNEGSYNLKDDAVRLGFRHNLVKHLLRAKIAEAPGRFRYQSINTMLLGLIVQRASGKKLQEWLEEKLWKPMGAEHAATWNVDSRKRKQPISSAAINGTARDFAKLGRLYIKKGILQTGQIISAGWVNTVSSIDTMEKYEGYKNQWWNRKISETFTDSTIAEKSGRRRDYVSLLKVQAGYRLRYRTEAFSAIGFLNQIMYVHPNKNLIIVRLGRGWPQPRQFVQTIYSLGEQL